MINIFFDKKSFKVEFSKKYAIVTIPEHGILDCKIRKKHDLENDSGSPKFFASL